MSNGIYSKRANLFGLILYYFIYFDIFAYNFNKLEKIRYSIL